MDLAWISLLALGAVVVASCTSRVNPGVLAVVLAWLTAVYAAPLYGTRLGVREVLAGFPVDLFLTLVGVTLLFTQAQVNGTLDRATRAAVGLCRGNAGLIPLLFFLLAAVLSSVGAGNIAAAALLGPLAMATAHRVGVPAFLMTILVAHGAIAGGMSPVAPTGVVANNVLRDRLQLSDLAWQIYADNFVANTAVALGGYFLFGGWRLFRQGTRPAETAEPEQPHGDPLTFAHIATLLVIAGLVVAVVGCGTHVGLTALAGAALLAVSGLADEGQAVRRMPWAVILMVCGVTVLTALLERTGGADRLTELLAGASTPGTLPALAALLSGVTSVYSSTTGVVLPAFLPLVPGLVERTGGDPLAVASAMIVGGNLVDCSPLSTVGALCIASAGVGEDRRRLFRQVLFWGLAMAVVGAVGCYFYF